MEGASMTSELKRALVESRRRMTVWRLLFKINALRMRLRRAIGLPSVSKAAMQWAAEEAAEHDSAPRSPPACDR
jgi:hypothetical protein